MTINQTNQAYDPLCYPLLFPNGLNRWHFELFVKDEKVKPTKVTALGFYERLFSNAKVRVPIYYCRKDLFQQFFCDMYVKMECEKLSYFRKYLPKLRASEYTNLAQKLGDGQGDFDDVEAVPSGRLVVLPATYVRSERYLRQKRQDAMSIAVELGHPDIFLTFTCNPKWPEIIGECERTNTKPEDTPDICNRVLAMKMKEAIRYIKDGKIFGNIVEEVKVVEFQERSLVHAHVLFFLDRASKNRLANPVEVDRIVRDEIPDESNPVLRKRVIHHMIHTPCNTGGDAQYQEDGRCIRGFPKAFCKETSSEENSFYVTCKRRSPVGGGQSFQKRIQNQYVSVGNEWVVTYNPELLRLFDAHINVEIVLPVRGTIKYLFKYICKGPNSCTVQVKQNRETGEQVREINKIREFVDARFVSSTFALWNFFGYEMFINEPSVQRLQIHLERQRVVYYEEGDEQEADISNKDTTLTAFFEGKQTFIGISHIGYKSFPKYFVWDKFNRKWEPRKKFEVEGSNPAEYDFSRSSENNIGRVYTVSLLKYYFELQLWR